MQSTTAQNGQSLTADELAVYETEGLVRPRYWLSEQIRERLRHLAQATLDATPGQRPESINCPHISGWIGLPEEVSQEWLAIAGLPEIVDRVESAIGPDIILWGSQFFCKPAETGLEVPWHQDGDYWPIRPLNTCTVWLAIDDAGLENGCMRYIPGSHRERRIFPHLIDNRDELVLNQVTDPRYFDESTAKDDILSAGEFSLHDVYLIHGSQPNRSGKRRAALVLRYMSATSHYDRSLQLESGSQHYQTRFSIRPIYLIRGDAQSNTERVFKHPHHSL